MSALREGASERSMGGLRISPGCSRLHCGCGQLPDIRTLRTKKAKLGPEPVAACFYVYLAVTAWMSSTP